MARLSIDQRDKTPALLDNAVKLAVVSSGYSDDANMDGFREQGFTAVLKKPYGIHEMKRTLNSLLDARRIPPSGQG